MNMKRYCFNCASKQGYLNPDIPNDLLSTQYQLDKFIKHTTPTQTSGVTSIFSDPSTSAYQNYIVSTVSSGYVEIDNLNRVNICWVGSSDTGATYKGGLFHLPTNSVKVVLHDNRYKIHAFPISTVGIPANFCIECGAAIL
jgi:hypothetical protein